MFKPTLVTSTNGVKQSFNEERDIALIANSIKELQQRNKDTNFLFNTTIAKIREGIQQLQERQTTLKTNQIDCNDELSYDLPGQE